MAEERILTAAAKPVLHVLASLDQRDGGPLRAVLDLSSEALNRGLSSEIIGVGELAVPDNPLPLEYIHRVSRTALGEYRYSRTLRQWLRANIPRFRGVVLHGMWQYPQWVAAQESIRARVPYACFPHGMLDHWPVYGQGRWKTLKKLLYWRCIERRVFRRAAAILFTATREMDRAAQLFNLPPKRLLVMPYGIKAQAQYAATPRNSALSQPDGNRIALFLGRVHPKKNVDMLIRAWKAANVPNHWHLVVAGSGTGSYLEKLEKLTRSYGLTSQIHFVGHVSGRDKSYLLSRSDWFLLPSSQENFGIAVLEAIQAGCAVAISDQVYLADYLRTESEVLSLKESVWSDFMRFRMVNDRWRSDVAERDHQKAMRSMNQEHVVSGWCTVLAGLFDQSNVETQL